MVLCMKKQNKLFDYDFKQDDDPGRFQLGIRYHSSNRLFKFIFKQSKIKLKRKKRIDVSGDIDKVKEFKVPVKMYKLIKTMSRKEVMIIFKKVRADGIDILTHDVDNCKFVRASEKVWDIVINFSGIMMDKR